MSFWALTERGPRPDVTLGETEFSLPWAEPRCLVGRLLSGQKTTVDLSDSCCQSPLRRGVKGLG